MVMGVEEKVEVVVVVVAWGVVGGARLRGEA